VVKDVVHIPVGIKSTVSLYLYGRIFEGLIRSKLKNSMPEFITLVGQLDENPGVNLDTLRPIIPHIPTMGWQGTLSGLTYSALATFSSMLGTRNPFLSASGGIRDHEGVINAMALGATTVQLLTAVLDKGPTIISKILDSLERHLDSHGIRNIADIIGASSRDFIPSMVLGRFMLERDALFGKIFAEVDHDACTGCGLCSQVCTECAVVQGDGKASIDAGLCRACNLCVLKCPTRAIRLRNAELLEQFIKGYKDTESVRSFRRFMEKPRIGLKDKVLIFRSLKQWGLV
jgi:Pyruvate/2-oxoacid:ferredoxin oxidoreductase delta subunit